MNFIPVEDVKELTYLAPVTTRVRSTELALDDLTTEINDLNTEQAKQRGEIDLAKDAIEDLGEAVADLTTEQGIQSGKINTMATQLATAPLVGSTWHFSGNISVMGTNGVYILSYLAVAANTLLRTVTSDGGVTVTSGGVAVNSGDVSIASGNLRLTNTSKIIFPNTSQLSGILFHPPFQQTFNRSALFEANQHSFNAGTWGSGSKVYHNYTCPRTGWYLITANLSIPSLNSFQRGILYGSIVDVLNSSTTKAGVGYTSGQDSIQEYNTSLVVHQFLITNQVLALHHEYNYKFSSTSAETSFRLDLTIQFIPNYSTF